MCHSLVVGLLTGFGDIFLDRYLKKLYSCGKIDMTLNKRELINLNFKDENLSQKEKTEEGQLIFWIPLWLVIELLLERRY